MAQSRPGVVSGPQPGRLGMVVKVRCGPTQGRLIRQNAKRLYAAFPGAAQELGIQQLLDTPITDATGVAQGPDSICNASVPLPTPAPTGVLPTGGGVPHYPDPITECACLR